MTLTGDRMLQVSDTAEAVPTTADGVAPGTAGAVDLSVPSDGASPETPGAPGPVAEAPVGEPVNPIRWLLEAGITRPVSDVLGVAAIGLTIATPNRVAPLVLAVVAAVFPLLMPQTLRALRRLRGPAGLQVIPRTALVVVAVTFADGHSPALWIAAALGAGAILLEPFTTRIERTAIPYAANLPGITVRNRPVVEAGRLFVVNLLAALAMAVLSASGVPVGWLLVPAVAAAVLTVAVTVDAAQRIHARRCAELLLPAALAEHAPAFALHWDAPPSTEYQVTMWLAQLERIGTPFIVVLRNPRTFAAISRITSAPVLVRRDPRDLDLMVTPSLRAVFYVNNAARNTHFVRFTGLTHVQLNHGESDKAPSYSPVFRMYDRDFVAGQAAIDRFARAGVVTAPGLFTIVGRPQVADVLIGASTTDEPTALYAPTWGGANVDSDYCSLPIGVRIVESLLERGYTVVYRPHPYVRRNAAHAHESKRIEALLATDAKESGRKHRFGAAASTSMSLPDCFNVADLLISDVSSVVPDFLYSEKPFAITAMLGAREDFVADFPVAEAGYVIDRTAENLDAVLDEIRGADGLAPKRHELKSYFLGAFPAEEYQDVFVREARALVVPTPEAEPVAAPVAEVRPRRASRRVA